MTAAVMSRRGALAAGLAALAGCGPLPSSGPRWSEIVAGARGARGNPGTVDAPTLPYALITLDPAVVQALGATTPLGRLGMATRRASVGPAPGTLGPGDVVGVTIFESQSGGLFLPAESGARPGNFVSLPAQQVDLAGNVTVPFAGTIRATGQTTAEVERAIIRRLAGRALDPQVVVSLIERRAAHVSVAGDVYTSLRFPLEAAGERVLGALARAGGPRFPAYESRVTLQRAGQSESVLLTDLIADPAQNIPLLSGDTLLVSREQRFFTALGAVGQTASITQLNRRFPFEDRRLNLVEALSRAGGLQDDRANASAVFLFRFENASAIARLGLPAPPFPDQPVPVVYRADFGLPTTFFLASRFEMRNEDMLFVSTAPLTDYEKFLRYLLPFTQSAANSAGALR